MSNTVKIVSVNCQKWRTVFGLSGDISLTLHHITQIREALPYYLTIV